MISCLVSIGKLRRYNRNEKEYIYIYKKYRSTDFLKLFLHYRIISIYLFVWIMLLYGQIFVDLNFNFE